MTNKGSSQYSITVMQRYVRMKRLTEADPIRWGYFVSDELSRLLRTRTWWTRQHATDNALRAMVSESACLIDGRVVAYSTTDASRNVRQLFELGRKLQVVDAPLRPPARYRRRHPERRCT